MRRRLGAALIACAIALVGRAHAAPSGTNGTIVDRTVARFSDPEASDPASALRFVTMRELVIEAWLVAYERAPAGTSPTGFDDKQLRLALERHVIETILGERPLAPAIAAKLDAATKDARMVEVLLVGGDKRLEELLARATGSATGGAPELNAIFRRRARAEAYLEHAVAQPVEVTDVELRAAYAKAPEPLAKMSFEQAAGPLRAFLRAQRLREGSQAYYQAVRTKLRLEIVQTS